MKKIMELLFLFLLVFTLSACTTDPEIVEVEKRVEVLVDTLAGTYVGHSWEGESSGVLLEDANQKIETILTLDEDGMITDASILFWKLSDNSWYTRQDGTARIDSDLMIDPVAATPGAEYSIGTSMFDVDTHDKMSLYSVVVGTDGTVGLLVVEPVTRYQFEIKLAHGYDFDTMVSEITVDGTNGGFIPTVRTSSSGLVKPAAWSELSGKNLFSISYFDHVMTDSGVFEGLTPSSSMKELLESIGVTFTGMVPNEMDLSYGRHSMGGWQGNYDAIAKFLIGKDANDVTSLIDWSVERWGGAINEDNYFGIDVPAGATKTAQDSADTIAGATVRMSRESTSFQRALVAAGIISEEDVIKGRF